MLPWCLLSLFPRCLQHLQCSHGACNTPNAPMVLSILLVLPQAYSQCSVGNCSLSAPMLLTLKAPMMLACLQYSQCSRCDCNTLSSPTVLTLIAPMVTKVPVLPWFLQSWCLQYSQCSHGAYSQCCHGDCSLSSLMVLTLIARLRLQYPHCRCACNTFSVSTVLTLSAPKVIAASVAWPWCLEYPQFAYNSLNSFGACITLSAAIVLRWWLHSWAPNGASILPWCLQYPQCSHDAYLHFSQCSYGTSNALIVPTVLTLSSPMMIVVSVLPCCLLSMLPWC